MCIGKPAQTDEVADALSPIELQFGRSVGEQNAPQLAVAEQMVELGRCHIDQEQNQYPNLDRGEAIPAEGCNHVRQKAAYWIVVDKREFDEMFEQANDKHH